MHDLKKYPNFSSQIPYLEEYKQATVTLKYHKDYRNKPYVSAIKGKLFKTEGVIKQKMRSSIYTKQSWMERSVPNRRTPNIKGKGRGRNLAQAKITIFTEQKASLALENFFFFPPRENGYMPIDTGLKQSIYHGNHSNEQIELEKAGLG